MLTVALVSLVLTAAAPSARADYQTEKDDQNMGVVERSLAKFTENPAIFDGKKIAAGVSVSALKAHAGACTNAIDYFNKYFGQVSAKGKSTDRAKKIVARVQVMQPHCKELIRVGNVYISAVAAGQQAAASQKAAAKATCDKLRVEVLRAMGTKLYHTLDMAAGTRTPATAEHIAEFRADFEKLVPVCQRPEFKGVVENCKGQGILLSSETNRRFDYGDLCAPAVDPKATMTAVAMRLLELAARAGEGRLPTPDSFSHDEGWIHDTNAVAYKNYFQVTEAAKKESLKAAAEAFKAAGVELPKDLSVLWAKRQAYLDALKVVVDATGGEWKIAGKKCSGYGCKLSTKSVAKYNKGAKVKASYSRDWHISKNGLGIPLERTQSIQVVYQMKGEPYCQARQLTVTETYKGSGKYQKAKGVRSGYVRFQQCK